MHVQHVNTTQSHDIFPWHTVLYQNEKKKPIQLSANTLCTASQRMHRTSYSNYNRTINSLAKRSYTVVSNQTRQHPHRDPVKTKLDF